LPTGLSRPAAQFAVFARNLSHTLDSEPPQPRLVTALSQQTCRLAQLLFRHFYILNVWVCKSQEECDSFLARLGGRTEERAHPDLPAASQVRSSGAMREVGMSSRFQPSDFGLLSDPTRPVLEVLGRAFVDNLNAAEQILHEAHDLASQPKSMAQETDVMRMAKAVLQFSRNADELSHWIFTPKTLSDEAAGRKAEAFRGLGDDYVKDMRSRAQKLPEGKPARMRQSHILAFEFMLQSKENSLIKATKQFCTCGQSHRTKCTGRFKTGIRGLKKVLRKHAPDLLSRYEAFHPNRNTRLA
jgi:hypothetical protein